MATTHGHTLHINGIQRRSPTYLSWEAMKSRCLRLSDMAYRRYGGRGIKVCERWMTFSNFLEDMGERPSGTSLDRIDNNGHYEPGNVRWATLDQQNNNRHNTRFIEFNGMRLGAAQWARLLGIKPATVFKRLEKGLPVHRVLSVKNLSRWEGHSP